jgi:hypothetical protein
MKKLIITLCCSLLLMSAVSPSASYYHADAVPVQEHALDFYGNICWTHEKARLDNFAIHLQENPDRLGLIIVYSGRHSCAGEARTRAERAKRWVEGRGVAADRVVWKDGGYREDAMTWLWLLPRDLDEKQWPIISTVEAHEVTVFSRCKGKIYKPAKCDKP